MKELTITFLLALALVAGAVTGSMILTGIAGQPTVQACDGDCFALPPPPDTSPQRGEHHEKADH